MTATAPASSHYDDTKEASIQGIVFHKALNKATPLRPDNPLHTCNSAPSASGHTSIPTRLKATQRTLVSSHMEIAPKHIPGNKTYISLIHTPTVSCSWLSTCSPASYASVHYFATLAPADKRTVLVSHHMESPPTDHQHGQTVLLISSKLTYISPLKSNQIDHTTLSLYTVDYRNDSHLHRR